MRNLIIITALLCTTFSFSQSKEFIITGQVLDDLDQAPLEAATVYLERVKDSSLVTYTITDKDGSFSLEDASAEENLNLLVSYVGYQSYKKQIAIKAGGTINLGKINLQISNALDEVVIKSSAPVTIKKDTLEFNVNSFKTKKDATVEDLLKQLKAT